jgi:hypothetical protein
MPFPVQKKRNMKEKKKKKKKREKTMHRRPTDPRIGCIAAAAASWDNLHRRKLAVGPSERATEVATRAVRWR